jgi:cold shock CspA family protein
MRGQVAVFSRSKCFGFIKPTAGDGVLSVFFHATEARYRKPKAGDVVEFENGPRQHGRVRAQAVRLVERAPEVRGN